MSAEREYSGAYIIVDTGTNATSSTSVDTNDTISNQNDDTTYEYYDNGFSYADNHGGGYIDYVSLYPSLIMSLTENE